MIVRVREATQMQCGRCNQMCHGEACMAFRLMDPDGVPGAEGREAVGFCGMGGRPTVMALHVPEAKALRGIPDPAQELEPHLSGANVPLRGPGGEPSFVDPIRNRGLPSSKVRPVGLMPGGVIVTPSERAVLNGCGGECADDECPGCVAGGG